MMTAVLRVLFLVFPSCVDTIRPLQYESTMQDYQQMPPAEFTTIDTADGPTMTLSDGSVTLCGPIRRPSAFRDAPE